MVEVNKPLLFPSFCQSETRQCLILGLLVHLQAGDNDEGVQGQGMRQAHAHACGSSLPLAVIDNCGRTTQTMGVYFPSKFRARIMEDKVF